MNSLSIFVVEDEIITAKGIAKNIRKFGYQLAGIATSGSEAVSQILETRPDLVLIDIFLEHSSIDGIAVAEKIKSHLEIPVLYLTAHSDRETLERAKVTTPFGYVLKPYSIKNLQISIELALHKHQQDQELAKREKMLTSIFNATQDSLVATDHKNQIVYMNSAAENLTKSQVTTTKDSPTAEIIQLIDERTQKISEPIQKVMKQGEVIYLEDSAILLKKTDQTTQVSSSSSLELNQEQQTKEVIMILARPQNEIHNFNNESSLTNHQLLKDLQTYLIDLVLHELRTPLTVILSTAESLESYRQKWTIEKQDKSLRRIQQTIGTVRELLDNVAIWNELEKSKTILNPEWVNPLTLSQNILDDLKIVDVEEHQLNLSIHGKSKMLWLDKSILRCIIVNLLLNSLKYSPPGTLVSLSLGFSSNNLSIQIRDRGIGIPLKQQKCIFEPFQRATNASKFKGTGLGLAIVKAYIQLCGGNISLSSKVQSGTTFTVNLPFKE